MPYIGSDPSNRFVAPKAASVFSGDGSTTAFTLDHAVGSDEDILESVDGVIQEPSVAYAVSNGTTLTFTAAPSSNSGNMIFVYYLFRTVGTVSHPSNNALTATTGTFSDALSAKGGAVFNEDSADVDFRVESNDSANMFVVNAGTNKIGIGTDSPAHAFSVVSSSDGSGISGDDAFIALFNNAEATDDKSFGVKIQAGSTNTDSPLTIKDHDDSNTLFTFRGLGQAEFQNSAADYSLKLTQTNTSADGILVRQTGGTPNSGSRYYLAGQDETNTKAVIYTNGDFYSRSGTYGSFSDESIKHDIKDANSQWDDIKAIKVRNFRLKDEVAEDADYPYHIGVIAQEVEASGMNGLVSENLYDTIENEDGTKTEVTKKGVKYSILHMKALKALQEAMTRIETLEAEVKALKG